MRYDQMAAEGSYRISRHSLLGSAHGDLSIIVNMTHSRGLTFVRRWFIQSLSFALPRRLQFPRVECVDLEGIARVTLNVLKSDLGWAPHRVVPISLAKQLVGSHRHGSRSALLCLLGAGLSNPAIRDISPRYLVPFDISSPQAQRSRNSWMKILWGSNRLRPFDHDFGPECRQRKKL